MGGARWCLGAELWTPKVKVHSSASCSSQKRLLPEDTPTADAPPAEEPAAAVGQGQVVKGEGEGVGEEHRSQQREVFTIWMKSLVLNGSGCTVFDSRGRIVYRVDNYGSHRSVDVCLMDITGSVVLQVLEKFRRWEGYRCGGWDRADAPRRLPWFTVVSNKWSRGPRCEFRSDGHAVRYKMDGGRRRQQAARASWIVDDATGLAVAEVKRKLTATGVSLGEDVLTLVVEPNVDHSLIMGLLVVHGLINHSM
ncbi:protein LURP-one-related 11-like [Triticum dicoccoides]|uniref:protein LURP-one-related 11-like n=1 Tax=Triticum dicoccoides TaxID=85692 RepID=UPI000E7A96FD|nr:protein LURP-one-related 11-like [Triticum dicoccoides]